jgi:recombination protein RecT
MSNEANGAIELRKYLTLGQAEIGKAIRGSITPDLLIRTAITYCQKQPKVLECSRESIAKCLLDCAALGLLPDGTLGTAYLVPYKSTCTLIIGYRGLIELARRSGQLSSIEAHVVRDGDEFHCEFGLHPVLKHSPSMNGGEERKVTAVYAIARFKDGAHHAEVMTRSEVDAIRSRSKAGSNSPWASDYAEMAKKTVVRRMMKYLPLSPDMAEVFEAADREYVQDAEVAAPAQTASRADALAARLTHQPVTPAKDELSEADKARIAEQEAIEAQADAAVSGNGRSLD